MEAEAVSGVAGRAHVRLVDTATGETVYEAVIENTVTDAGLDRYVELMAGLSTAYVTHMAIGDGSATSPGSCAATTGTETALGNELTRTTVTATKQGTGTVRFSASFTPPSGSTWSVCEAGLFDAASGGTLIARITFGPLNIDSQFTLTIDWDLIVSR